MNPIGRVYKNLFKHRERVAESCQKAGRNQAETITLIRSDPSAWVPQNLAERSKSRGNLIRESSTESLPEHELEQPSRKLAES